MLNCRFFAVTHNRVRIAVDNDLSRAELLVWAAIELESKPNRPIVFTLERLAESLKLSVASVRRAIHRLMGLGLIAGQYSAKRHHLAPATSASEPDTGARLGESIPAASKGILSDHTHTEPDTGARLGSNNLTSVQNREAQEAHHISDTGDSPEISSEKYKKKLLKNNCPIVTELVSEWNLYPGVAADLIRRFGDARVRQVLAWGAWMKRQGRVRSLGWVYQALVRGWAVPDGFHAQQSDLPRLPQATSATPGEPVSQEPDPIARLATVTEMLQSKVPAIRRMGARFAADWGISAEVIGAT